MHKLILKLFDFVKQTLHFFHIVCWITMTLIILYWVQNLIGSHWGWLDFSKSYLDWILNTAGGGTASGHIAGMEAQYVISLVILVIIAIVLIFCMNGVDELKRIYGNLRIDVIKTNEKIVNYQLQKAQENTERRKAPYSVFIKTRISKQYANLPDNDIDDQNRQMNDFIFTKTQKQYSGFKNGFLYMFDDFANIDEILKVMFKVLKAQSRLDYFICVQVNNDIVILSEMADLDYFGKIVMAADTAYKYKFNKVQGYKTEQVGLYQKGSGTLEMHEFKENYKGVI